MALIAPSLLAANFADLKEELERIATADVIHFDVMDGHFVPNISFGPAILKDIDEVTDQALSVHLMISEPKKYYKEFIKCGADVISFHYESFESDAERMEMINLLKSEEVLIGMAVSPKTDYKLLTKFLKDIHIVLIMAVEPGFGGQKFIANTLEKVDYFKTYLTEHNLNVKIEVDGGINEAIAKELIAHKVDLIVMGTAIFSTYNPATLIKRLQRL